MAIILTINIIVKMTKNLTSYKLTKFYQIIKTNRRNVNLNNQLRQMKKLKF